LFIILYLLIIFVVAILLSTMGMDFIDSFTASVANMGNVGPGFGTVGSLSNYSEVPIMGKFILAIQMLLGRLEIYSFILIFFLYRWR
jgi:Trk-type K+ transport systems, membrane components